MAFEVKSVLRLEDKMSGPLRKVEESIKRTERIANRAGDAMARSDRITQSLGGSFARMGSSATNALAGITSRAAKTSAAVAGIGIAAGTVAAGIGTIKLFKDALKGASDIEQNNVAMEHFIGLTQGAEKAKIATKSYVDYLEKNANLTPFETGDVMNAGRRLINVTSGDIAQAKQLLTVSENMSALNPGKSLMDAVEALADMKTGETERMKEFGFKVTAKQMAAAGGGDTVRGAMKLMLTDVAKTFDGGADKLSKTSLGMWSTITGTFKTGIAHMGTETLDHLKPQLERLSKYLTDGGADKLFAAGSRMMTKTLDGIIRGVDKVKNYLDRHYFNNPDFQKITTFEGQIGFIFNDLTKSFDTWYTSGGDKQISNITNSVISFLSNSLSASSEKLLGVGVSLGSSIGSGMLKGLEQFAKDNPLMSALITYIVTPGPPQVKLAAATGVGTGIAGPVIKLISDTVSDIDNISKGVMSDINTFKEKGFSAGIDNITNGAKKNWEIAPVYDDNGKRLLGKALKDWDAAQKAKANGFYNDKVFTNPLNKQGYEVNPMVDRLKNVVKPDGNHAGGLARVPYDGYVARLHKDETVLTRGQAEDYRNGNGGNGGVTVNINGGTYNVRKDDDIDSIARGLIRLINEAEGAVAIA
ncbi:hypothetical protein [Paenibacillus sp. KN14-4R]|uniref:hypothetical protein n=1 Tax=Paenibacillus sp. KN14-4R TaxID=3445773 RepID=UPI003FA0EA13